MENSKNTYKFPIITIEELNYQYLIYALIQNCGNRTQTANSLKVSIRSVRNWLYEIEKNYNICFPVGYCETPCEYLAYFLNHNKRINRELKNDELENFASNIHENFIEVMVTEWGFPPYMIQEKGIDFTPDPEQTT